MKKSFYTLILFLILPFMVQGQCECYKVEGLQIVGTDSMELVLSNACDENVYLNLYVISTIPPFDTLAKQTLFSAAILPLNTPVANMLTTQLTTLPAPGTYRVSITNLNLLCDSLAFSTTFSSISEQENANIQLFPNPFSKATTLKTTIELHDAYLLIYDNMGNIVTKINSLYGKEVEIELNNLPSGNYMMCVIQDNKTFTSKAIHIIH